MKTSSKALQRDVSVTCSRCGRAANVLITNMSPKALRPDVAAQYLGVTPFRVEEWMRDGLLEFVVPPGTDTRVIPVAVLDKFFDSPPRQKGTLAGRGRNAGVKKDSATTFDQAQQQHKARLEKLA